MENISDLLKERGLSVTAQRIAVLKIVDRIPHITADKVVELATEEIGSISKQSVYDVLNVLSNKGVFRRIQPSKSPARYERERRASREAFPQSTRARFFLRSSQRNRECYGSSRRWSRATNLVAAKRPPSKGKRERLARDQTPKGPLVSYS